MARQPQPVVAPRESFPTEWAPYYGDEQLGGQQRQLDDARPESRDTRPSPKGPGNRPTGLDLK